MGKLESTKRMEMEEESGERRAERESETLRVRDGDWERAARSK